jgi:hypothetical protein
MRKGDWFPVIRLDHPPHCWRVYTSCGHQHVWWADYPPRIGSALCCPVCCKQFQVTWLAPEYVVPCP